MYIQRRTDQVIREALRSLRAQVLGMWRFRWSAIAVSWLICMGGWITVYLMPDVYAAYARVYVDTENAIEDFLGGIAAPSDVMSEVNLVVREIVSRPNLAEVARSTDLAGRASNDAQFQDLLTSLQNRISVEGNRDGVYSISFSDPDRVVALEVVDTLLTTFVEKSLGADRTDTEQAQQFLQDQINDYESRLSAAEDRLATFKRENVQFMPDQQGDYFSRMQSAQERLQITEGRLRLAVERRDELVRQIEGEAPVFGIMAPVRQDNGTTPASVKIRELELQLEELRLQYTDRHPRIGQILDTIELLRAQEELEVGQRAQATGSQPAQNSALDVNPVYQNMRIQLSNVEVEIASLRAERDHQSQEVTRLRTLVDTIPQVEAELNRLNRDYDVVRAKHQQLLQQLETASIGEDVSRSIDEVQFRVIDPPFSDVNPVGPYRALLLTIVLLFSLAVGICLAFLRNQLNPVFVGSRSVVDALEIPVLASVSLLQSESEMKAERNGIVSLFATAAVLVVVFVTVVLYSDIGSFYLRELVARI